jgi:hypothetical protein
MKRGPAAPFMVVACLAVSACGARLMKLPTGPATDVGAGEATAALSQATSGCASVRTLTAELGVRGSAGGRRVRGRLLAGVAAPASVRLEAVAPFGPPLFMFVATGDDATLLLPRDERVLEHGRPAEVLGAIAGVPLGAGDLATTLIGCAAPSDTAAPPNRARRFGDVWLEIQVGVADDLYLRRENPASPWELVAAIRTASDASGRWRAEYTSRQGEIPQSIRLTSVDEGGTTGRAFDLRLALSQVETNVPLDASVFDVEVPPSVLPITIDELRRSGPLAP